MLGLSRIALASRDTFLVDIEIGLLVNDEDIYTSISSLPSGKA